MGGKKADAIRMSTNTILSNGKASRKAYDQMWNHAARAPIFCKISKRMMENGKSKKYYRTTRLIGSHAYNIAASGAALKTARIMHSDCKRMRIENKTESSRAPWLPSVSKGAKMMMEQFLAALAQEAAYKGHIVRECARTKRLSRAQCRLGWEVTIDSIPGLNTLVPKGMIVLPLDKKKKDASRTSEKAARGGDEDEEYAPPEGDVSDLQPEEK